MFRPSHASRLACSGLAVALASCAPKVVSYEAVPRRICPGSSTLLRWQVTGNATLSAEPPLAGVGTVRSNDSARFIPVGPTVFTLTVHRFGKTAFARQEVSVLDPGSPRTIVDTTGALGRDSLKAVARLDTATWDSKALVTQIFGDSSRPLVVYHAARQTTLLNGVPTSDALRGTPLRGDWVLHAPLQPGEVIGDTTHPPPDRLRIAVRFTCER